MAAGLLGGALLLGSVFLTSLVDGWLFAAPGSSAAGPNPFAEPLWAAGLLLLVNGILVCEERVWRGLIQTSLVRAWGTWLGLTVSALAFSLKHAVIDGPPGRLILLFVFGLITGVIRIRWSTTASTLAHAVTNLAATAILVAAVL